jgi:hypothetical protein
LKRKSGAVVILVYSVNSVPIRVSDERWQHIREGHPEMDGQQGLVMETIESPDTIQEGDYGELLAVRHYAKTPLTSKHLIVAYREVASGDGFAITAYFTSRPLTRRKVLWTR